jgi:hypothetical protein
MIGWLHLSSGCSSCTNNSPSQGATMRKQIFSARSMRPMRRSTSWFMSFTNSRRTKSKSSKIQPLYEMSDGHRPALQLIEFFRLHSIAHPTPNFVQYFFFAPSGMMDTNRQNFRLARLPDKLQTARESLLGGASLATHLHLRDPYSCVPAFLIPNLHQSAAQLMKAADTAAATLFCRQPV